MSEKKLRIEQWRNERPDLFVLRAYCLALPQMDDGALMALARYVWERSQSELTKRLEAKASPNAAILPEANSTKE
jgi:hypothetical protein